MAFNIPYFRTTLTATGSDNLSAYWRKYGSPTSTTRFTGDDRLLATPAYPNTAIKSWEWWFIGSLTIPVGSNLSSRTFTTLDLHNTASDVGGGIGWNFGSLVSPFYFTIRADGSRYRIWLNHPPNEPNNEFLLVSTVTLGARYDFVIQVIWGRLDQQIGLAGPGVSGGGVAGHPNNGYGRTRVWINGSDTPLDTGNINNLQRAANGGSTYTQTAFQGPWDGYYTFGSALSTTYSLETSATRVGRSFGEAQNDSSLTLLSSLLAGGTASQTSLSALSSDDILLPSSLTGGDPTPTPSSHFGRWTAATQWNAGVISDPPDQPPTVVEGHLGRWATVTEWNADLSAYANVAVR